MEPQAKALFLEASFKHALASRCCSKGTELLFTWSAEDVLEVRLNGRMVEAFANPALAQELFANYVNDDPISPQVGFGEREEGGREGRKEGVSTYATPFFLLFTVDSTQFTFPPSLLPSLPSLLHRPRRVS